MPKYLVNLGTEKGDFLEKEFDAPDEKTLREGLTKDGYYIFGVRRQSALLGSLSLQFTVKKMKISELISFNQELLAMTKAGLPIIKSLDTIIERTSDEKFLAVLKEVRETVKGGGALSDAFERFPNVFPTLYVATIRAGEKSGDMVLSVRRYIDYLKKVEAVKKKVVSASIYPIILIGVAVSVIVFLLTYVVPTFSKIYVESGSRLPYPTLVLISITGFIQDYFIVMAAALLSAVAYLGYYSKTEEGMRRIDSIKLRIPFIGEIIRDYSVSKFSRTLSTVIGGGIPLVESLRMVSGVLGNKILEWKAHNVTNRIEEGSSLTDAVAAEGLMPPLAVKMMGVAEGTGGLGEMLIDIADYYENQVDSRLSVITTVIEPMLMLVMGAFVAMIVIAMYLPVFKLAETAAG